MKKQNKEWKLHGNHETRMKLEHIYNSAKLTIKI